MGEAATARSDGRAFDKVAAEYDRHRPTYPDELVDRACEIADLRPGDRVLEVGCGSGQLTRALVARGLEVTALEPGERLLALARQHLGHLDQISWVNARFEDAQFPERQFRAVFSASAFHWVDPEVGWERAGRVLTRNGTLALISYFGLEESRSRGDQELVRSAIGRIAPELAARWPAYRELEAIVAGAQECCHNVSEVWAWIGSYDVGSAQAGPLFTDVALTTVPMLLEHTAEELNGQLGTMSFYAHLSPSQRIALGRENEAIGRRLGRPIRSSVVAALVTARVAVSDDGGPARAQRRPSARYRRRTR